MRPPKKEPDVANLKRWLLSSHAVSRAASRLGLIIDSAAEKKISDALNSDAATFIRADKGAHLYEVPIFGKSMVAVCAMERRIVLTLIDAKEWYKIRTKKAIGRSFRKGSEAGNGGGGGKGSEEEE